MPLITKKRGRPKGFKVTAMGLPAKKMKKGAVKNVSKKSKVSAFIKLHSSVKEQGKLVMLFIVDNICTHTSSHTHTHTHTYTHSDLYLVC